jgi:hypothetical protein
VTAEADFVPAHAAELFAGVPTDVNLDDLPDRYLDKHELKRLVASVAAQTYRWEDQLAWSDNERHYVCLHRDANVDVWLLCWTPQNDTGWHDHDISSGAVAVAQGSVVEHNLAIDRPSLATVIEAGNVFCFGPDHIHRMMGYLPRSVSIHAYSPALWRVGQYTVTRSGVLQRVSVSYADELRPLPGS